MALPPPDDLDVADPTPEALEDAAARSRAREGFRLALPAYGYLIVFFAVPLVIVAVVAFFGRRSPRGSLEFGGFTLENFARIFAQTPDGDFLVLQITARSFWFAILTTLICLLMAYPLAYFMATRTSQRLRAILLVLVMIPFWSNFLVRTYAWRVLLSPDGIVERITSVVGFAEPLIFTSTAIIIGLVYGYLPFMVLPLYAALERMDWRLVEAARDLYAGGWDSFWRITWPISRPGVIAGSILVFIPSIGAYVTPEILGGARETMLGSFIVRQFLSARDFPFGSALSVVVMVVMLGATLVYFRTGGRNL